MARNISAHNAADGETLYEQPLGSESAIRESWSEPATTLGLPLLAAIYERGFYHGIRWTRAELRQVLDEMAQLEAYWSSANLAPDVSADLRERAEYLREAVRVAEKCSGAVTIS